MESYEVTATYYDAYNKIVISKRGNEIEKVFKDCMDTMKRAEKETK